MWAEKMPSESQKSSSCAPSLLLSSPPYSRSKRDAVFGPGGHQRWWCIISRKPQIPLQPPREEVIRYLNLPEKTCLWRSSEPLILLGHLLREYKHWVQQDCFIRYPTAQIYIWQTVPDLSCTLFSKIFFPNLKMLYLFLHLFFFEGLEANQINLWK